MKAKRVYAIRKIPADKTNRGWVSSEVSKSQLWFDSAELWFGEQLRQEMSSV